MIFLTAIFTGFLGSFHCAGMCGPIALAVPLVEPGKFGKFKSRMYYHVGRTITYSIIGALLGAFGTGLKLAGLQQSVSIVAGIIMIVIALYQVLHLGVIPFTNLRWIGKSTLIQLFNKRSYTANFGIGLLNGLLPCGFVYIAAIGAVATQSVLGGALFMFLFGIGTWPVMFTVSMISEWLNDGFRVRLSRLTPLFAFIIGILFVVRGLNLGIPYVSPMLQQPQQHEGVATCH